MDAASINVAEFLSAIQWSQERLGVLCNHFTRRGARPHKPHLVVSGHPFRVHKQDQERVFDGSVGLGLIVIGTDSKEYELGIDVLWNRNGWTISTQAWVENEQGGQTLLRELPENFANELPVCIEQLHTAIESLFQFVELVPGRPAV